MAKEIERKFLVLSDEYKQSSMSGQGIEQAYLRGKANCFVSLFNEEGRITISGPTGWTWDVLIPRSDTLEILQNALDELTFRVRWTQQQGEWITIKGRSSEDGLTRDEWEYQLPLYTVLDMSDKLDLDFLVKHRWYVDTLQVIIEVDEFADENDGLVVAEIEFTEDFDHSTLVLPSWIGKEVTGDVKYYNSQLLVNPYSQWKKEE